MNLQCVILIVALQVSSGILFSSCDSPTPPTFRLMKTSELVPVCLVDKRTSQAGVLESEPVEDGAQVVLDNSGMAKLDILWDNAQAGSRGTHSLAKCTEECERNPNCMGVQHMPSGFASCTLRMKFKHVTAADDTCLSTCRAVFQERGFKDVPLVPLDERDGQVYMREDCLNETIQLHNNTYFGVPWDWQQPGLSFVKKEGYGWSPLLKLVTPKVLGDLVRAGTPPWWEHDTKAVDLTCTGDEKSRLDIIEALKAPTVRERALVVDAGACICSMLSNGWDPVRDLMADVVLLLHKNENFSPASPHTFLNRLAEHATRRPCIREHVGSSTFATDVDAFTALADSPHVLGMYFMQTPPIAHEKVFLVPLGADPTQWVPSLLPHLKPRSPWRRRPRTALYQVGHNLASNYRRDVFNVVQANFAPEPLHVRYLPWAANSRMESVALDALAAVYGQSPIGIGENCFRHSELLLAGAIPVVQASLGVAAMRYVPHLAVSRWHEVTPELLKSSYQAIWSKVKDGYYSFEPLTNHFWQRHINDTAWRRPIDPFYAKFPNPSVTCPSWDCL